MPSAASEAEPAPTCCRCPQYAAAAALHLLCLHACAWGWACHLMLCQYQHAVYIYMLLLLCICSTLMSVYSALCSVTLPSTAMSPARAYNPLVPHLLLPICVSGAVSTIRTPSAAAPALSRCPLPQHTWKVDVASSCSPCCFLACQAPSTQPALQQPDRSATILLILLSGISVTMK